jgi:hypothetical protein
MLKTRFQINSGSHLRLLPTIRDIIAEGGVKQLYRGGFGGEEVGQTRGNRRGA